MSGGIARAIQVTAEATYKSPALRASHAAMLAAVASAHHYVYGGKGNLYMLPDSALFVGVGPEWQILALQSADGLSSPARRPTLAEAEAILIIEGEISVTDRIDSTSVDLAARLALAISAQMAGQQREPGPQDASYGVPTGKVPRQCTDPDCPICSRIDSP